MQSYEKISKSHTQTVPYALSNEIRIDDIRLRETTLVVQLGPSVNVSNEGWTKTEAGAWAGAARLRRDTVYNCIIAAWWVV